MKEVIYEITHSGKMIPKERIVRCGECRHRLNLLCVDDDNNVAKTIYSCKNMIFHGISRPDDFFCALGERE